ncbi:MAG: sulfite exporter TauE/SafE family protein [Caldilineaceae bacterium]|nr:sulfite exporter TauE/SafE family protein [Caldilineaceae bacterium]MCB9138736.1 sulfite exporter TauE/SafE family protein [Caldilineaceae bacterium]
MIYLLAIAAGILAGIINTLAGSGSLVTLPMLIFLGLPANVANGTNRVGVIFQNIVGIATFRRHGSLDVGGGVWYVIPAVLGAIVGARIAVDINEQMMNYVIGAVMVIMLFVILLDPKKWLRDQSEVQPGRPGFLTLALFFVIGIYGGFIQAGVGIFLLAGLVLGAGYNLAGANALKLVIVLALSLSAIAVFILNDQVAWGLGLLMAVGQSIGAWLAARFAATNPNANVWVRRLLIAIILFSIVKLFGIWDWAMGMLF